MPDFIPKSHGPYYAWLRSLESGTAKMGPEFGLTPEQISTVAERVQAQLNRREAKLTAEGSYKAAVQAEKKGQAELNTWIRKQVAAWKVAASFTAAMAAGLRVVGTSGNRIPLQEKVEFHVQAVANQVHVHWRKGNLDAVAVYARKPGDTEWTKIGTDMNSPFIDTRPVAPGLQAEVREYMLRGLVKDVVVTPDSDIRNIAVQG